MRSALALSEGSRYGIVLILLFGAVVVTIVWPGGTLGALVTTGLQGASVLVAIGGRATEGVRQLLLLVLVVASIAVAALATGSV